MKTDLNQDNIKKEMLINIMEKTIDMMYWMVGSGLIIGIISTFIYGLANGLV